MPAMCFSVTLKFPLAAKIRILRIRFSTPVLVEPRFFQANVAPWLSQWKMTFFQNNFLPQKITENRIGTSSRYSFAGF